MESISWRTLSLYASVPAFEGLPLLQFRRVSVHGQGTGDRPLQSRGRRAARLPHPKTRAVREAVEQYYGASCVSIAFHKCINDDSSAQGKLPCRHGAAVWLSAAEPVDQPPTCLTVIFL